MKLLALALPLLLAAPAAAQSSIERLVAIADASADADQPSSNFGSAAIVTSGKTFTSTPTFRVWMTRGHYLFDLAGVAGRPLPLRARLRVYQEQASAAGCLDVTVHRLTQSWSEPMLTWQNKPAYDPAVEARGCVGDSFDLGWKSFDVTALVHLWLQGLAPNHGLLIRDPSESSAGAARPLHATSREGSIAERHPHLELSWGTLPYGAGCGTGRVLPLLDLESGSPAIGSTYALRATGLAGSRPMFHWVGLSDASWNGIPLPLDLSPFGFSGCAIFASLELELPGVQTDSRGRALISVAIPPHPFLRGQRIYHQALTIDTSAALSLTNGFAVLTY
jgi:hypothetical protein